MAEEPQTCGFGGNVDVNPSVDQVVAAIRADDPGYQPRPPGRTVRAEGSGVRSSGSAGLVWTLVVAVVWILLAAWRPTTTWHLAPLLIAAAWPWVVGQDLSASDPTARRGVLIAGAGGLAAGSALTATLALAGRLEGPTWTGAGTPVVEAFLLAGAGALVATLVGVMLTVRRTTTASARLGTRSFTASEDVVNVEGNAYFPLDSGRRAHFSPAAPPALPLEGRRDLLRRPRRRAGHPRRRLDLPAPPAPGPAGQGPSSLLERDRGRPDVSHAPSPPTIC